MSRREPAINSLSDAALLEHIAKNRDEEAFLAFHQRHERAAMGLALHLCGGPDEAMEAVQETMLAAWRNASDFKGAGSARSWLLRVAANKCMSLIRQRRSLERRRKRAAMNQPVQETVSASAPAERNEMLGALRAALRELPEVERHVVTLYYAVGLSQAEVAETCSISQQLVSFKIKKALDRLRGSLVASGCASAALAPEADSISLAILDGAEAPPSLLKQTMEALGTHGSKRAGRVASTASGITKTGVIGVVSAVALAAGFVVWQTSSDDTVERKPEGSPAPGSGHASAIPAEPIASGTRPFNHRWTFDRRPVPQAWVLHGEWLWKELPGLRQKAMCSPPSSSYTGLLLPPELPEGPLRVDIAFRPHTSGSASMGVYFGNEEGFHPCAQWRRHVTFRHRPEDVPWYVVEAYWWKGHLVQFMDTQLGSVRVYEPVPSGGRIVLCARNAAVRSVTMRRIAIEKLPKAVRELEATMAGIPKPMGRLRALPFSDPKTWDSDSQ